MDIIIQSLGFKAGQELESFVKEKISKLETKSDKIIRANVTLFLGPDSQPDNKHCEIRLEIPGNDPFVKKKGETWELAIVEAVNVLESQLKKIKEKLSGR